MTDKNYYKVVVKTEVEDKRGNMKVKREGYIVAGVNPTDVETKVHKHLTLSDMEIVSISMLNILEVIE